MHNRSGFVIIDTIFHAIIISLTLYFFWQTAYTTITWWKGCANVMAAVCLGNDFPPGSLILTLFGWIFTKIKLVDDVARSVNMSAGIIGSITALLLFQIIVRISRLNDKISSLSIGKSVLLALGAISTALFFAFSYTAWHNSTQFAPYLLTATFTAMILLSILVWYQKRKSDESLKWIFIILLLFGLDISVHRTNLLLLPGFLIFIAIAHPKTFSQFKSLDSRRNRSGAGSFISFFHYASCQRQPGS